MVDCGYRYESVRKRAQQCQQCRVVSRDEVGWKSVSTQIWKEIALNTSALYYVIESLVYI